MKCIEFRHDPESGRIFGENNRVTFRSELGSVNNNKIDWGLEDIVILLSSVLELGNNIEEGIQEDGSAVLL